MYRFLIESAGSFAPVAENICERAYVEIVSIRDLFHRGDLIGHFEIQNMRKSTQPFTPLRNTHAEVNA
jgi:hypothetical protein